MKRRVNFVGNLKDIYGDYVILNADSWVDIFKLMEANFNNFKKNIINGSYAIVRGTSLTSDGIIESLSPDELTIRYGSDGWDWFIVPELSGAGDDAMAIVQFVVGAALCVAAYFFPAASGWLIPTGVGLMLGGASMLLTPTYDLSGNSNEEPDEKPSILYSGGVNNSEQGGIVPIVCGQVLAGSVLISAGVTIFEGTKASTAPVIQGFISG